MTWSKDLLERAKSEHPEHRGFRKYHSERLHTYLKPIRSAPPLRRLNGFGVGLYGRLEDPAIPAGYLKLYFISAFWLPVIPLCAYAVVSHDGGFRFYNSMSLWGVVRSFGWRTLLFYLTAWVEGAVWLVAVLVLLLGVVFGMHWIVDQFR